MGRGGKKLLVHGGEQVARPGCFLYWVGPCDGRNRKAQEGVQLIHWGTASKPRNGGGGGSQGPSLKKKPPMKCAVVYQPPLLRSGKKRKHRKILGAKRGVGLKD